MNFEEFLKEEYSNIAQAHFKSIESISTFFRYYLLIIALPISALTLSIKNVNDFTNFVKYYNLQISALLSCIASIGFFVLCYIINLRLDVITYARVINGIRKYFYDKSSINNLIKINIRGLPQSPQLPSYIEKGFFFPVVLVFAIIDTLFAYYAFQVFFISTIEHMNLSFVALLIISFFSLHLLIYYSFSNDREHSYLKSNIIGVDIDGVLNDHRKHFCELLHKNTGNCIKPEDITVIPVHECHALKVTREDEKNVFNSPDYWIKMPLVENDNPQEVLVEKLRNSFKMQVFIFSHRPWPIHNEKNKQTELRKLFINEYQKIIGNNILIKNLINRRTPIKTITKYWLKKNGFVFDKLVIEGSNDYTSDPRAEFQNRFYYARKNKFRYFVEDDWEKAIKLSFICDVVFLYSQPYNAAISEMPSNVIRVNNWSEIYRYIRSFA